jgi:hypothetical protein
MLIITVAIVFGVWFHIDDTGSAKAERLISSSAGLDLRKVYFIINTQREFHDQLYDYAITKLTKAGLLPIHDRVYKEGAPVLQLTLNPTPLGIDPVSKVMYRTRLELFENVYTERTPRVRAWAVTWSYGLPDPLIVDSVSLDQLKNDVDEFLDDFILDYKYANPDKR